MALTKVSIIDKIECLTESGIIQLRIAERIMEDGVAISQSFHRRVITPGQDYSNEPQEVQQVCVMLHTPERIAAWQAREE